MQVKYFFNVFVVAVPSHSTMELMFNVLSDPLSAWPLSVFSVFKETFLYFVKCSMYLWVPPPDIFQNETNKLYVNIYGLK